MRIKRNDWYAYTNFGFRRMGQCTLEDARSRAHGQYGDDVHMLIKADQLPKLLSRVKNVIEYHEDLEDEHTENMRHDADTGRWEPDDE